MLRILLSYSRAHFDPGVDDTAQQRSGSSAHILASGLHEILCRLGEVTYIDPAEHKSVSGQTFDLFVGQISNFRTILDTASIAKSILFAVNMHPAERNAILKGALRREGLSPASLAPWDLVDEGEHSRALVAADHILVVGNMEVYNSYVARGVPKRKIKILNYGVGLAVKPSDAPPDARRFAFVASEIGLRKGFDILASMVHALSAQDADFHVDVVGSPVSPHYEALLADLVRTHKANVTDHGWLDSADVRYENLLRECTFILAPALEEGQAGAVLDGVRRGLIPIVSRKAGIDFSPLGHIEPHLDSPHNLDILTRAVGQTPDQLRRLQRKTIEYYQEYHEHFLPALDETVRGCLRDELYPMISITLPIYNKERTIEPLLKHLHSAAVEYGNVELHVIFDGCEDGTEERVRRFFAKRHDYPTTFDVTPNIFEVRSNNLGLKRSTGKYCVVVQDDNYIYDKNIFFEAVTFLEKNPRAVILGCLAGVNFYPRGTYLEGSGQIAMSGDETYWRQDALTDPDLKHQFFQADACMRGPLVMRKSFLEKFGYLDEIYAPLYMDDMDIGFRAASHGLRVYCMLSDVENKSLTMAHYDDERNDFFARIIARNTRIFYDRWSPGTDKDYSRVERTPIADAPRRIPIRMPKPPLDKFAGKVRRALRYGARVLDSSYCRDLAESPTRRRGEWVKKQVGSASREASVLTVRPENPPAAGDQVTFVHDHRDGPRIADPSISPASADVVVFADALERLTDPLAALREASRLLKPGGRLIVSASARGTGRGWHEQALTRTGFRAISITADGGLFANVAQTLWRSHDHIIGTERPTVWRRRVVRRILQVALFNAPTVVLNKLEQRWPIEDSSVGYLLVATPLEPDRQQ